MPGTYTRSKLLAEQKASQAAATGFPVVIASPTMPVGPHFGNLTPPTLMLQYFLNRRVQLETGDSIEIFPPVQLGVGSARPHRSICARADRPTVTRWNGRHV